MSKITPSVLLPMHVTRQPPRSSDKSEDSRVNRRSNHQAAKSSLASALEMADDLSILKTSLRRRRDGEGESVSSEAWVDHVLEDHAEERYIQLKGVLAKGYDAMATFRSMLNQLFPDPSDMASVLQALLADEETAEELRSELEALLSSLKEGGDVRATKSHHHQGVDVIGDGFTVTGWAAMDELPEALEDTARRFALGVQWHPEADPVSAEIGALVEAARA